MTALSIPERARELIKERLGIEGDLPELMKLVTAAMRSERELCAKELEETASHTRNMIRKETLIYAAEKLREGGQK